MIVMQLVCPQGRAPQADRGLLRSFLVHCVARVSLCETLHGAPKVGPVTKTVRMVGNSSLYGMLWMF
ncbi:MAG: hypothetical protein EBR42_08715 [Betaproteobacteria bacterium]|nr:hypothetical protein [Betaproteobacteria bacterium]